MERARNEDGRLNCTSIVRLTEHSTLRSRKRRSSYGSEGSVKGFPSGYDLYIAHISLSLTP